MDADGPLPDRNGPALRANWLDQPAPSRLDPARPDHDQILATHRRAIAAGHHGYLDPASGLFVMTARYLRDRAWCCDRGCRHCPYVGADEPTEGTSR